MKRKRGFQGPPQRQVPSLVQQRLQQAVTLHKQGMLSDAKTIYEDILKQWPNHFDALHMLGVVAYQTKALHQAEELIGKAIQINSNVADAYNNRGNVLRTPSVLMKRLLTTTVRSVRFSGMAKISRRQLWMIVLTEWKCG